MHTVSQIAQRLQTSEAFVYARLADGSLRHFRLGSGQGGIRISEEQLQEFLDSRERGGQPRAPAPKVRPPKLKHLSL